MNLYLGFILAYAAVHLVLGLRLGRRVRTSGDFFVAGRSLGPGLLFATLMAANIGAGSTVGAAGLGYRDGLAAWWWVGSAGLGSLALAFAVGPRMRRAAAEHGLHTVGDYLEQRYSPLLRGVVALLLWVGTLAILAGQLIAAAWVLEVVAGLPKLAGCVAAGAVMTFYFAAGGLSGAARLNALQLALELTVFLLLVPFALASAGGADAVRAAAPPAADYFSFWSGGGSGLRYLAVLAPAFVVSPGLLQKVFAARDDRAVRLGVGANAAALLLFAGLPVALGILARALHPELPNRELAFPTLLRHDLPPLLGALGLAAIFSTEVNTADTILFMLSTSLTQDLYRRFLRPQASDAELLRTARGTAVLGGALGVALAVLAESVIGVLTVFYTLLGVSLLVPVLAGLYVRRAGTPEALAAIGSGLLATLAVPWLRPGGAVSPALAGLAASALGCAVSLLARFRPARSASAS
jgi:SSS family solute:Na+ symporter